MRKLFNATGIAITILSAAFVFYSLSKSYKYIPESIFTQNYAAIIIIASLLCASANQFLAIAWYFLLSTEGRGQLKLWHAIFIFNRTQIYKYLPGNVFHMVGRYAMAKKMGASHTTLAVAQFSELALVSLAAASVSVLFSYSVFSSAIKLLDLPIYTYILAGAVFITTISVITWKSAHLPQAKRNATPFLLAAALYSLFILANASLGGGLSWWLGNKDTPLLQIIAISATAWLLGFIIPGAPGGLGAREAAMIAGLTTFGSNLATATTIALSHRMATIIGDTICAISAYYWQKKIKPTQ